MTEGWAFAILILLLGVLVLIGITSNASLSHDDERRKRRLSRYLGGR
jgi:hypothetical protein